MNFFDKSETVNSENLKITKNSSEEPLKQMGGRSDTPQQHQDKPEAPHNTSENSQKQNSAQEQKNIAEETVSVKNSVASSKIKLEDVLVCKHSSGPIN